jgi:catechol 2,3-dioxygenase-like lactoylglutathione lyase family enzyme
MMLAFIGHGGNTCRQEMPWPAWEADMKLATLDHVNVRTRNLGSMIDWYSRILGMKQGRRPGFDFPGAWMYVGDKPYLHLVGVDRALPAHQDELRLEHFALSASGLEDFLGHLRAEGVDYRLGKVPDFPIVQVNVWDPDGNHIHIDFHEDEARGLEIN